MYVAGAEDPRGGSGSEREEEMNCPICGDYAEITKEGNGDYELWCDCGYHEVIDQEQQG